MMQYLKQEDADEIAYHHVKSQHEGQAWPTIMFLGGYRSDMEGTKALYLQDFCKKCGHEFIRFDYGGHGSSGGKFEEGTIGSWTEDALAILDEVSTGPVILVGSSMGGWISLLIGLKRPERVAGIIGIAAAPDFTRRFYEEELDEKQRAVFDSQGYIDIPNEYSDEPYRFTKNLIDEAAQHCLLERDNHFAMPLYLLQGMQDSSVPWQTAHRIKNTVIENAVDIRLIEDGDHSLSRSQDLEIIVEIVSAMSESVAV